jgi:hypothetical protein
MNDQLLKQIVAQIAKTTENSVDDYYIKHHRSIKNCEKCPNPTKIYNPKTKRCINRTSNHADELIEQMQFCDNYFKKKLTKQETGILNTLINIEIYDKKRIKDFIPKDLSDKKISIIVIVVVLLFFVLQFKNVNKNAIFILNELERIPFIDAYGGKLIISFLRKIIENISILGAMASFCGFGKIYIDKILNFLFPSRKDKIQEVQNNINDRLKNQGSSKIRNDKYQDIYIEVNDYKRGNDILKNTIRTSIKNVLNENGKLYIKENKMYIKLNDFGLNTNELYDKDTNVRFHENNSVISIELYSKSHLNPDKYELYNNERYMNTKSFELDELNKRFNNFKNLVNNNYKTIINARDKIREKIILLKKELQEIRKNKKSSTKLRREIEELQDQKIIELEDKKYNIKNSLNNYLQFTKTGGLLEQMKTRINGINNNNWRSEIWFFIKYMDNFTKEINNGEFNNIYINDLDKIVYQQIKDVSSIANQANFTNAIPVQEIVEKIKIRSPIAKMEHHVHNNTTTVTNSLIYGANIGVQTRIDAKDQKYIDEVNEKLLGLQRIGLETKDNETFLKLLEQSTKAKQIYRDHPEVIPSKLKNIISPLITSPKTSPINSRKNSPRN